MPEEVAVNGRILNVDLTTGEIDVEELPQSMYRELLGGYGLGARLLFDRVPADAEPLGPDNILGIFPGLLTGTPLFGQRFQVVCKSPKNGGWGDANCGGDFGPMLKFTGSDGILFSGWSAEPVYLYVDDDTVELRDASEYWGMLAIDCEDRFKEELGKKISVALIGPGGCGAESIDGSDKGEFAYPRHTHRPEYETMAAFGAMTGTNNTDAMLAYNHWCNEYGLDTISAGATIAFAVECYEHGILTKEDTDGIELNWGNASSILEVLHKIGRREEGIGDLLADGVRVAAERIGGNAEEYAVHIDGEEPPMHDPKHELGYANTYAMDPTPARHTLWGAGNSLKFEGAPQLPQDKKQFTGRGPRTKAAMEFAHVINSSGMCEFIGSMSPTERLPEWINLVTGWDVTQSELLEVGERIANLRMAFAAKHGNNVMQRKVHSRVTGDPPQQAGPHEGFAIDLETLNREWAEEAGWDPESGKPSRAKLESLGLADVADALGV